MAIAITEPVAEIVSTSDASAYSFPAAFTPTANSTLVIVCMFTGSTSTSANGSGMALTWTRRTGITFNTTDSIHIFTAKCGGTTFNTTFQVTTNSGNATGCSACIFQITGNFIAVRQTSVSALTNANPTFTWTDDDPSINGVYIAGFGMPRNPPTSTPPTSWTEAADTGYTTPTAGFSCAYRNGGETSSSVTFTSASAAYGIAGIELWEQPAPTVDSCSPSSGSIKGGTTISIAGDNFFGVSSVTFDGASIAFTQDGRFDILIDDPTPRHPVPGAVNVVVTNNDGQTSGATGNSKYTYLGKRLAQGVRHVTLNPATLNLTGWHRGNSTTGYDNSGTATWLATASAGTSGSNGSFTEATNKPAELTLNTHVIPDFDGTNDKISVATTLTTYVANNLWWSAVVFKIDTFTSNNPNTFQNAGLIGDAGGFWGWHVGGSGSSGTLYAYQWDGTQRNATRSISTGVWYCAVAWYDGANINLQVNGDAVTQTAASNIQTLTGAMRMGINFGDTVFLDGQIAEVLTSKQTYSASQARSFLNYARARYGIALI